jgi:hypothetical protein
MEGCFETCQNFEQDIILKKTDLLPIAYVNMFKNCNNSKRKQIFVGTGASPGNLIAYTNRYSIVGDTIT